MMTPDANARAPVHALAASADAPSCAPASVAAPTSTDDNNNNNNNPGDTCTFISRLKKSSDRPLRRRRASVESSVAAAIINGASSSSPGDGGNDQASSSSSSSEKRRSSTGPDIDNTNNCNNNHKGHNNDDTNSNDKNRRAARRGSLGLADLAPSRASQRRRSSVVSSGQRRRRSSMELMIDELSSSAALNVMSAQGSSRSILVPASSSTNDKPGTKSTGSSGALGLGMGRVRQRRSSLASLGSVEEEGVIGTGDDVDQGENKAAESDAQPTQPSQPSWEAQTAALQDYQQGYRRSSGPSTVSTMTTATSGPGVGANNHRQRRSSLLIEDIESTDASTPQQSNSEFAGMSVSTGMSMSTHLHSHSTFQSQSTLPVRNVSEEAAAAAATAAAKAESNVGGGLGGRRGDRRRSSLHSYDEDLEADDDTLSNFNDSFTGNLAFAEPIGSSGIAYKSIPGSGSGSLSGSAGTGGRGGGGDTSSVGSRGSKDFSRPARPPIPASLALYRRSSVRSLHSSSGVEDSSGSDSLTSLLDGSVQTVDLESTLNEMYNRSDKKTFIDSIKSILQKTTLVLEVTQQLSESHSLEDLLAKLTNTVVTKLGVERCTIFLHDRDTDELFTRASEDEKMKEIRFPCGVGIAGQAFSDRTAFIIPDAYQDPRFNPEVDVLTGFRTKSILCTPIWRSGGKDDSDAQIIGVAQAVNKRDGNFTEFDLTLLENMITPCAHALINAKLNEDNDRMMNVMVELSKTMSRYQSLDTLLPRLTSMITRTIGVEHCEIFLYDIKADELHTVLSDDSSKPEMRFPSSDGIVGQVFTEQRPLIIKDAVADPRCDQSLDKQIGVQTRSIMCAPILKAASDVAAPSRGITESMKRMFPAEQEVIGVCQVINKVEGQFNEFDLKLLQTVTTQAAHALVNAQLQDEVIRTKTYNERMLESIKDGILSVDPEGIIVKVNRSFAKMLDLGTGEQLIGMASSILFRGDSAWIAEGLKSVAQSGQSEVHMDRKLRTMGDAFVDVNVTIVPLTDPEGAQIGCIVQMEDVTREKRLRTTMSRYMSPKVAERLMEEGAEELGGKLQTASVLFSDIRNFTSISEQLGPSDTVQLLNDYFSSMTEIIFELNGNCDKFIGDAIMATYGVPFESPKDADNAVQSAIEMQLEMSIFNSTRKMCGDDVTDLKIGIGVNTGEVVSGNIGSMKRMEYTSIGDAVNLAARLESACKTFGADILVSEFTVDKLKSKTYVLREVDRMIVKGKTQPVAIFEVLDHLVNVDRSILATKSLYGEALESYRSGEFTKASELFSLVLKKRPHDGASKVLLSRCERLASNPPANWQGVWTMETK